MPDYPAQSLQLAERGKMHEFTATHGRHTFLTTSFYEMANISRSAAPGPAIECVGCILCLP